jgi:tRNA(fMet)-specific endonuclease VapC
VNYLLDTNIISEFISKTPNQRVVDYILTLDEKTLFLSVITITSSPFLWW